MKKLIALLLALVMVLGLAACGASEPEAPAAPEAPAEPAAPVEPSDEITKLYTKPTEEITLDVWYAVSGVTGEKFAALIAEYCEANPNIKIEPIYSGNAGDTNEKVTASILAGTQPDVALLYAGPLYTGAYEDWTLEGLIEDPAFDKGGIYDGVWEYAQFQGRNCALPYATSVPVLYYNTEIIAKAGIDMATEAPKSWDDLYALAERAVKDGGATYGFDCSDVPWLFKSMLSQNGNTIIDTTSGSIEPIFNDEKAVEVGQFWQKLTANGLMPIDQHGNADNTFLAGQTAFIVSSSVRLARWTGKEGVPEFGCLPMPAFEKNTVALGGPVLVCLAKENPTDEDNLKMAAAWDLLKFLMSEEKQTEFALETGYIPVYKNAMESEVVKNAIAEDARRETVFSYMANSWSYWHFDEMGTMDNIIGPMISEIENGADVQEALDKGVDQLLDEM